MTGFRCANWHEVSRCEREATVWLRATDGHRVPGCWYCDHCAAATLAEYSEKLGERWTTEPLEAIR